MTDIDLIKAEIDKRKINELVQSNVLGKHIHLWQYSGVWSCACGEVFDE